MAQRAPSLGPRLVATRRGAGHRADEASHNEPETTPAEDHPEGHGPLARGKDEPGENLGGGTAKDRDEEPEPRQVAPADHEAGCHPAREATDGREDKPASSRPCRRMQAGRSRSRQRWQDAKRETSISCRGRARLGWSRRHTMCRLTGTPPHRPP